MTTKVRINLANPDELLELPGATAQHAEAVLKFRVQHGPIQDATTLAAVLRGLQISDALWDLVDYTPVDYGADEGPGG